MAWFTGSDDVTNTITTFGGGTGLESFLSVKETVPGELQSNGTYLVENANTTYTVTVNEEVGEDNTVDIGLGYVGIMPGTVIAKDPVVNYEGDAAAYIRYKVEVSGVDAKDLKFILGSEDAGVKVGEWVYVTEPKKTFNKTVFDHVEFSKDLGNEFNGAEIKVVADAVQADNIDLAADPYKGEFANLPWPKAEVAE